MTDIRLDKTPPLHLNVGKNGITDIRLDKTPPLVLVVDDDKTVRFILRQFLELDGYWLAEAEDGKQALATYERLQPDLVLLDVMMPVMDGFETCSRLRSLPGGERIPILMMTSLDDNTSINRTFEAGATDYIAKPVNAKIMRPRLRRLIQAKQTEDALRRNERLFRAVVEDQTELICRFTAEGIFTFVNPAYCRYFDMSPEELIGRSLVSILPKENYRKLQKHLVRLTQAKPVAAIEYQVQLPNGEIRWQQWTDRAIFDEYGQLIEFQSVGRDVTEFKWVEEQLRKLSRAVAQSPNSIVITNASGRIEYVNPKFTEVTGFTREEAIGQNSRILKSGEMPPETYQELWQTIISGQEWQGELLNRRKNGELFWESVSISPIRNAEGAITHFLAVKEDITRRKTLEETWRRYEFIVNTSKEFMTLVDQTHTYAATNESYCRAHNKSREEIVGRTVADVWGEDTYLAYIKQSFDECLAGNEVHFQGWLDFAALGPRYVDVTYYPYYDPDGVVTHAVVVSRDITERKRAEKELERVHAQNEQVLASLSSILIGVSMDDRITHWNEPAEQALGIPAQAVMGKQFLECGINWNWFELIGRISDCRNQMRPTYVNDIKYTRPDGKECFLNITVNPFAGEPAKQAGFLLVGEDVTERKVLESQLAHAQKMEAIGQLAAGIAHEINTPTQYVGDNTRFLQESFGDLAALLESYDQLLQTIETGQVSPQLINEVKSMAADIDVEYLLEEIPVAIDQSLEGINRVSKIVRAMKEFSHPGVEEKTALDINHAIESTITVARNEWKYIAEVETDFDPTLPLVPCLPGEFNQAVLNIIINAAHAIAAVNGNGNGNEH
ncbi:MAG: PAS domain S-box protein, partial [Chloroflexota bacterium]